MQFSICGLFPYKANVILYLQPSFSVDECCNNFILTIHAHQWIYPEGLRVTGHSLLLIWELSSAEIYKMYFVRLSPKNAWSQRLEGDPAHIKYE